MSDSNGKSEREIALDELNAAVEKMVRLNGSVPSGFYIDDWVVVGSSSSLENPDHTTLFVTPGSAMAAYQVHGLLDLADKWLVAEPESTGPFESEDE